MTELRGVRLAAAHRPEPARSSPGASRDVGGMRGDPTDFVRWHDGGANRTRSASERGGVPLADASGYSHFGQQRGYQHVSAGWRLVTSEGCRKVAGVSVRTSAKAKRRRGLLAATRANGAACRAVTGELPTLAEHDEGARQGWTAGGGVVGVSSSAGISPTASASSLATTSPRRTRMSPGASIPTRTVLPLILTTVIVMFSPMWILSCSLRVKTSMAHSFA